MFLGTQVRESTDYLLKQGVERINLIDQLGIPFIIHRSFSWLVLILILYIAWKNEKQEKYLLIRLSLFTLAIELFSGVLLAYFLRNQISHNPQKSLASTHQMHTPFYLPDGTLMPDIFVADRLHLNEKGYPIFAKQIKEFINRNP